MLPTVETARIQYLAIVGSIVLLALIFELIRKKRIREEYSLLWLAFGVVFLVLSVWREGLEVLSRLIGIAYPPASLFLILTMAILAILVHFSMVISELTVKNNTLVQEVGLLRAEVESLMESVRPDHTPARARKPTQ